DCTEAALLGKQAAATGKDARERADGKKRRHALSPSARKQATERPASITLGGLALRQTSIACGQRGLKRQPAGIALAGGTMPGMPARLRGAMPGCGMQPISARV